MDEYYYQRLLNDPKTFSATESVQNLEGWTFDVLPLPLLDEIESNKVQNGHNGAEPKRVEITGDKLERWWLQDVPETTSRRQQSERQSILKVLVLPCEHLRRQPSRTPADSLSQQTTREDHTPQNPPLLPMPITRSTFESISRKMRLPPVYLKCLERKTQIFEILEGGQVTQNHEFGGDYLFIDTPSNIFGQVTAVVRNMHHARYVLLYGLQKHGCDEMYGILQTCLEFISSPFLLPLLLIEMKGDHTQRILEKSHRHILGFERELGYHIDDDKIATPENDPDLNKLTIRLTASSGRLAWCKLSSEGHQRVLKRLEEEIASDREMKNAPALGQALTISRKMQYLKEFVQGNLSRTLYLHQRNQAYMSTIFSLIAQKDNALNMNLTNASVQIAKDSRTITEDSNRVALATARDSAAMRIISAVTLFFLPATFTATLFSTTFFNFQNEGSSVVSKKWIWLYPVVTIILTGLTHFAWFRSVSGKEKEIVSRHESTDAIEMR